MNLVPNKQLLLNVPFQPNKYWKKELCVDNKKRETIGDVFCPTCKNEKFVYTSTNERISFYDCKDFCNVLNSPLKDQKPTIMLFPVTVHIVLQERRVAITKNKSPLHFWRTVSANHNQTHPNLNQKKVKLSPNMDWTYPFPIGWWFEWHNQFSNLFIQFQSTVNCSSFISQFTEKFDLLSFQRRNPVDSRFWSGLCYYCS